MALYCGGGGGIRRVCRLLASGSHAGIAVQVVERIWTGDPHSVVLVLLPWRLPDFGREKQVGGLISLVVIRVAGAVVGWEVDGRRVYTRPD